MLYTLKCEFYIILPRFLLIKKKKKALKTIKTFFFCQRKTGVGEWEVGRLEGRARLGFKWEFPYPCSKVVDLQWW